MAFPSASLILERGPDANFLRSQMLDLSHPATLVHDVVPSHESRRGSSLAPTLAKVIWVELGLTIDVRDSDNKEDSVSDKTLLVIYPPLRQVLHIDLCRAR